MKEWTEKQKREKEGKKRGIERGKRGRERKRGRGRESFDRVKEMDE